MPADNRAHLVTLTGEGRRRIAKAQAGRLAEWAERDVRALVHLLAKVNRTAVD